LKIWTCGFDQGSFVAFWEITSPKA
jgi:hypothetical protein